MSSPEKELTAVLYSETEPTAQQRARFEKFLAGKYGREVPLTWKREEALRGGFRLEVGTDIYDWSLEGRMRQFRERLQQLDPGGEQVVPLMREAVKNWTPSVAPEEIVELTDDERAAADELFLLTTKPVIYAANIAEDEIGNEPPAVQKLYDEAAKEGAAALTVCAKVEEELSELTDEEKAAFIEDLGIGQSGLDKLVQKSYELLGLISFLTAGTDEVRAWTITKGTKAPGAAGKIHTDFERGFIRAEVVPYETLIEQGSMAACKEKGLVRSEGKDYVVQDGDIIVFRFNV